jgi:RNA-directed DNA polymerase
MKEPYGEGIANHIGPESCAGDGNVMGEALTGVHAGWVLSRERFNRSGRRRCWLGRKTKSVASLRRDVSRAPRGRRPQARMEALRTRTGRSHEPALQDGGKVRAVNPKWNTTAMHGYGKSDNLIVLKTFPNKRDDASFPAEGIEGRRLAKGNLLGRNKYRTQYRVRSGYGAP